MKERRRFTRVPFHGVIVVMIPDGTNMDGHVHNLCLKGGYVTRTKGSELSLEDEYTFMIRLGEHDEQVIRGVGRIVRKDEDNGYGLYFTDMDVDSFSKLRRLVELNFKDANTLQKDIENLVRED